VKVIGSPIHLAGQEAPGPAAPPHIGEHTDAVLRDLLGLSAAEIAELHRVGAI
jgi:crotonobetainyl-CoA:carnitine CoA-transferase CaiB-like acyl-CoA transferase